MEQNKVGEMQMALSTNGLQLKEVAGFGTLNCLYPPDFISCTMFIFALPPPFFLGAVMGWFVSPINCFTPLRLCCLSALPRCRTIFDLVQIINNVFLYQNVIHIALYLN